MTSQTSGNSVFPDPFKHSREASGLGEMDDQNDPVKMIFRLKDVRKTAYNWQVFQSAGKVGRIVIPSEVSIRDTRQIPFELDPPQHGIFRKLLEPWFKRPLQTEYQASLESMISSLIEEVADESEFEIVSQFALKLQSQALTLLLNIPFSEAQTWIEWGTHVFRSEGDALDGSKANILYQYIDDQIDKAIANPGEDLYSVLLQAEVDGHSLSREEIKGIIILTFAGGRDTVINTVTNTLVYFAETPEALEQLRQNPSLVNQAVEELIRYFSPLTQMGRVTTQDTQVCEHAIKADSRVSLCWAAANRDETVFEEPNEVNFSRKVNPHVGFGFSHHNCLGATHARQLMRTLLSCMITKSVAIDIGDCEPNIEQLGEYQRKVGFHRVSASLSTHKHQ